MAETAKLRFQKGDLLAIAIVVVIAVAVIVCFLPGSNDSAAYAQIYLNGELVKTLFLHENQTFSIEDRYYNEITVTDRSIAFTDSNCPGLDCVHSGSIHSTGRSLVCLPNGVEIRVVSEAPDIDFVVG